MIKKNLHLKFKNAKTVFMIKKLALAWQNQKTREWLHVGMLKQEERKYKFSYTKEAKEAHKKGNFLPFRMMEDLDKEYEEEILFPIFKNKLLPKSRPEYEDYLDWLNLDKDKTLSPIEELSITNGIKVTDNLQLFPVPIKSKGFYEVTFFSRGINYLPSNNIEGLKHSKIRNNKLYLMKDIQNRFDKNALMIRSDDPPENLGYCPWFFTRDFNKLIDLNGKENIVLSTIKVNVNAPLQFALLCKMKTKWPVGFNPFEV